MRQFCATAIVCALVLCAVGSVRANVAYIPIDSRVERAPLIVVGKIESIEVLGGGCRPAYEDIASIRIAKVLKNDANDPAAVVGGVVRMFMPSASNRESGSASLRRKIGTEGVWILAPPWRQTGFDYRAALEPLARQNEIAAIIARQQAEQQQALPQVRKEILAHDRDVAAVPLYTADRLQADLAKVPDASVDVKGLYHSFVADKNGRVGCVFIDRSGKVQLATRYYVLDGFSEGLAPVGTDLNKSAYVINQGYIDRTGKLIVAPNYDECYPFSNGLALVRKGKKYGIVDRSGKVVADPEYDSPPLQYRGSNILATQRRSSATGDSADALVPVSPNYDQENYYQRWGYADKNGKIVIKPSFSVAEPFSEGLAAVEVLTWTANPHNPARIVRSPKWGYIDQTGTLVIHPWFDVAWPFENGLAHVYEDGFHGFIDRTGKYVWRAPDYDYYQKEGTK